MGLGLGLGLGLGFGFGFRLGFGLGVGLPSAARSRCLQPKMRSTHSCRCAETCSLSRAARCLHTKSYGSLAHGGSWTSCSAMPSCRVPRSSRFALRSSSAL